MRTIAGIDEAGRGPVLGPMVVVGVESEERFLRRFRLKDSKEYNRITRDNLATSLIKTVERIHMRILYPEVIDYFVENLTINELELLAYLSLVDDIHSDIVYIDCFSTNVERLKEIFTNYAPKKTFIIEHKADKKYPIVSAASIIAKHLRDAMMDRISKDLGVPLGSGYPSDPKTMRFLKEISFKSITELRGVIRLSWKTVRRLRVKSRSLFDNEI